MKVREEMKGQEKLQPSTAGPVSWSTGQTLVFKFMVCFIEREEARDRNKRWNSKFIIYKWSI
jgi:hypothetical protein